ncbi:GSU2403 family nucleotidyltransferase fold protein [Undibacterium arcticum]|uniref:GSU2403 family nucleotidyltransferase fold protein n=2 Tax=Undibacterium arcticum TaxID=1762892 RepID=A0ABV7F4I2_9BURK
MRFSELKLSSQTAYAELFEQTRSFEMTNALAGLKGSFQKLERKGKSYWYFAYRDTDQRTRMAYVGPDEARVQALVAKFAEIRQDKPLAPAARSAIALGCTPVAPKHFRIIKRLAEYGFFRAGGILIGTHAFLAIGNMLGVRWLAGAATLDVDFAHAGRNVSVALPASIKLDVLGALESLEMGLLPITQFNGSAGAQYRNPKDQELRIDFVTSMTRDNKTVVLPDLNLALEPLKFMEFSLEQTTQGCVFGNAGSCAVNLPAPERFAVHKLIVYGERPVSERVKSKKDLLQAASLASYFSENGQADVFNAAWQDALQRGKGWKERALQGRSALISLAPDLANPELWAD